MTVSKSTANLVQTEKLRFIDQLAAKFRFLGLLLTLMSGSLFVIGKLFIKRTPTLHPIIFILIRAAISMGIYAVPVVKSRINLAGDNNRQRLFIFLRTVFGYLLVYLSITALKLISLGDSITILLSAPIYTSIFARIFLKERLTLVNVLFVLMSLAGVVLVARPPFLFGSNEAYDVKKLIGAAQSMVAALSFSVSCIVMRKLKGTNPTLVVFWFGASCCLYTIIVLPYQKLITNDPTIKFPETFDEWFNVIVCSCLGALADFLITQALQIESATLVSMARGCDIVVAFTNQAFFLQSDPIYWTSIVGAAIILVSVVANALLKYQDEKSQAAKVDLAQKRSEKEQQLQELEAQHHNFTVTEHLAKFSAVHYTPKQNVDNQSSSEDGVNNQAYQMDNVHLNDNHESNDDTN